MRRLIFIAIIICGAGGYFFLSGSNEAPVAMDDLPVIRADNDPIKELPDDRGGLEIPGQDNTLFSVLDDNGSPTSEDGIESGDVANASADSDTTVGFVIPSIPETQEEEITDLMVAEAPTADVKADVKEVMDDEQLVAEATVAQDAPVEAMQASAVTQDEEETASIVERFVEQSAPDLRHDYDAQPVIQAESEMAPPELTVSSISVVPPQKPDVPISAILRDKMAALPVAKPNTQLLGDALRPSLPEKEVEPVAGATDPSPSLARQMDNQDNLDRPLVVTRNNPRMAGRMQPIIEEAPASVTTQVQPVEVTQTLTLPDEVNRPAPTGVYYAQLASLPDRAGAQSTWDRLKKRYPNVLTNQPVRFFEANVAGRGTYTRVQVGGMSEAQARRLCADLSAAGKNDGCLVLRGG